MTFLSNALPSFSLAGCPARTAPRDISAAGHADRLERDVIAAVSAFLLAGGAALVVSVLSRVTAFS